MKIKNKYIAIAVIVALVSLDRILLSTDGIIPKIETAVEKVIEQFKNRNAAGTSSGSQPITSAKQATGSSSAAQPTSSKLVPPTELNRIAGQLANQLKNTSSIVDQSMRQVTTYISDMMTTISSAAQNNQLAGDAQAIMSAPLMAGQTPSPCSFNALLGSYYSFGGSGGGSGQNSPQGILNLWNKFLTQLKGLLDATITKLKALDKTTSDLPLSVILTILNELLTNIQNLNTAGAFTITYPYIDTYGSYELNAQGKLNVITTPCPNGGVNAIQSFTALGISPTYFAFYSSLIQSIKDMIAGVKQVEASAGS